MPMLVRPLLEDGSFERPRLLLEEQRFSPHGSAAVLRAGAPTADVAAPRALPTPPAPRISSTSSEAGQLAFSPAKTRNSHGKMIIGKRIFCANKINHKLSGMHGVFHRFYINCIRPDYDHLGIPYNLL